MPALAGAPRRRGACPRGAYRLGGELASPLRRRPAPRAPRAPGTESGRRSLPRWPVPSFGASDEAVELRRTGSNREQREESQKERDEELAHADTLTGPPGSRRSRVPTRRARSRRLRPPAIASRRGSCRDELPAGRVEPRARQGPGSSTPSSRLPIPPRTCCSERHDPPAGGNRPGGRRRSAYAARSERISASRLRRAGPARSCPPATASPATRHAPHTPPAP